MLNGSTLNGATLNGGVGQFQQIQIGTAPAFVWQAVVTMGGADVTAKLIGTVTVDREEGAAGVAEFALFYPPGETVPADMIDRSVTVDLISATGGETTQTRLFTGIVAEPVWDALARTMSVTATDNLQQRVESMTVAQIDALTGGQWSADVFDPLDGRSRWDYAQERLSSRTASLDCSPQGALRVTSWYASQAAHYVFGPGSTLYESINVDLSQLAGVTNRVELDVTYRYQRFREYRQSYSWSHPGTEGIGGVQGFCILFNGLTTELPTVDMVRSAAQDSGQAMVSTSYYPVPPSGSGAYCDPQFGFSNPLYPSLLLGASWTGARRWAQTVTETYNLTLTTAAGAIEGQQVISRSGTSFEIEAPEGWEESLTSDSFDGAAVVGSPGESLGDPGERDDEARRAAALGLQLAMAHTEIIAAHRQTLVSWAVPSPMVLGVDLIHTLEIDDQYTKARGKCSRRVDTLDFESGSCITELTISVMRGGGESDPLAIPSRPGAFGQGETASITANPSVLGTQLGGRFDSGEYDDERDGFSGNYDEVQSPSLPVFPRRFYARANEIAADLRDEHTATAAATYRVGIPNDLLEL